MEKTTKAFFCVLVFITLRKFAACTYFLSGIIINMLGKKDFEETTMKFKESNIVVE
jgi:uncharacterized membrane protein